MHQMTIDLRHMPEIELLQAYSAIIAELRRRGVVKTENQPLGGYTEWLVCKSLGLKPLGNSAKADAEDKKRKRYEIKAGRAKRKAVQFSAIRGEYDYLVAVAFNEDYSIRSAVRIPEEIVKELAPIPSPCKRSYFDLDRQSPSPRRG